MMDLLKQTINRIMGVAQARADGNATLPDATAVLPPAGGNATQMTDIHDIKPALAMGFDFAWLYWALGALVLIALAVLAWRLWRRRKRKPTVEEAPPLPADAEAFQRLDALAADRDIDPKLFYFRLSAILRGYVERRYGFPAEEMTTEELLPRMGRLGLEGNLLTDFKAFCRHADPIKFAGVPAQQRQMADHLAFGRRFVLQTAREPEPQTEQNHVPEENSTERVPQPDVKAIGPGTIEEKDSRPASDAEPARRL